EGALGPDEHSVVVEALEFLAADTSINCHETSLEDGRHALFLPVRAPMGTLLGIALILADCKSAGDDTVERVTAAPVRAIMQRLAVLLKPGRRSGDTHAGGSGAIPVLELTGESVIVSAPPTARARAPAAAAPAAATAISPEQVNDMLELELLPAEVPPARAGQGESSSRLPRLELIDDAPAAPPIARCGTRSPPASPSTYRSRRSRTSASCTRSPRRSMNMPSPPRRSASRSRRPCARNTVRRSSVSSPSARSSVPGW